MGQGEYGGNGSVHWKVVHGNGRSIVATGKANAKGVDDNPATGGDFTVTVMGVAPGSYSYNTSSGTLTVSVPIQHGPIYTPQVRVRWPQGASPVSRSGPVTATRSAAKKARTTRKATKSATARKKR